MRVSSKYMQIHTACNSLPLSLLCLSHHGQWPSSAVVARVSSHYTQMYVKVFYGVLVKFPEITLIFQSISPILLRMGSNRPCIDQFSEYRPSALPRNKKCLVQRFVGRKEAKSPPRQIEMEEQIELSCRLPFPSSSRCFRIKETQIKSRSYGLLFLGRNLGQAILDIRIKQIKLLTAFIASDQNVLL